MSGVAIKASPILVLIVAIIAGSAMDATIKHLTKSNAVLLVTFGRYGFGALFSAALWLQAGRPHITGEMWRSHGLRGAVIACSGALFFWALSVLPLAETIAFSFIGLLTIPFFAALLLGEGLRFSSLLAGGLGFIGVIVAAQGAPSADQSPHHMMGVGAVIAAAALFAVAMVLLRSRAQSDGPIVAGLLSSLMPCLFLAGPALAFSPPPQWSDWPFFLLLGFFAAVFMYLIARAYAGAEAQQLAPIHYSELIWATLIGYVLFHETPRPQVYLGAALIVGACVFSAYDERRLSLSRKRAP
jgi:S-adenosylmethionine uptake transporter